MNKFFNENQERALMMPGQNRNTSQGKRERESDCRQAVSTTAPSAPLWVADMVSIPTRVAGPHYLRPVIKHRYVIPVIGSLFLVLSGSKPGDVE